MPAPRARAESKMAVASVVVSGENTDHFLDDRNARAGAIQVRPCTELQLPLFCSCHDMRGYEYLYCLAE